ncbi:MAG: metallophosphoesterase [Verrucomicrobiota bacterium]|nr:metallophosphoesterase [Verrucomicrobiota bacterium]
MRTIIHLSDLHFGRTNPAILSPLIGFIGEVKPDLVAISGDFTQRARTAEYREAREFLDAIPLPQIVVPGNHDVPLHNLFKRIVHSLDRYRRYISDDLYPFFADEEIAVAGVNTARGLTWKDGRINWRQLQELRDQLRQVPDDLTKIVVTHHPFDLPAGAHGNVVGRSRLAIETLAECRVDMLLAGHFHIADVGYTATRYRLPGYSALIVSSGTSTSTRSRGQPNSLNVIRIERPTIAIERRIWAANSNVFDVSSVERFHRGADGWTRS